MIFTNATIILFYSIRQRDVNFYGIVDNPPIQVMADPDSPELSQSEDDNMSVIQENEQVTYSLLFAQQKEIGKLVGGL